MTEPQDQPVASRPRKLRLLILAGLSLLFFAVFASLGIWQVERLQWKRDLIARVDARIHAPAMPAPGPSAWSIVTAAEDEYRHVSVTGHFAEGRQALVYASTVLGPGYWVLAPFVRDDGTAIFINRGYVPLQDRGSHLQVPELVSGPITVTGLLRLNEPEGTLLRANRPAEDRWYSRDVVAMAKHLGVDKAAPFFIDADADSHADTVAGGAPVGGLTVIRFPNSHLSYATTWFAMALLSLVGGFIVIRGERRRQR